MDLHMSLTATVASMLKTAFGANPNFSSGTVLTRDHLTKPRVTLPSKTIHLSLLAGVVDWDVDQFVDPLPTAKDKFIYFEHPNIGSLDAPATVLDRHGRLLVWYLPGIIHGARIQLLNELHLSIKDSLRSKSKHKPKDLSKVNKCYGHQHQPVDSPTYGHGRISMFPATFMQAHHVGYSLSSVKLSLRSLQRLVDNLHQSASLKRKATRKWLQQIAHVEKFWSDIIMVTLPDLARAGSEVVFDHRDIPPSCTQLQMHSTCDTSLPFPLSCNTFSSLGVGHPPQCKLTPNSHITKTHPSNQEDPSFLGRGTVCYLACYNGEYYVIKDYWVEESEQRTALHEVNMMKLVQDIDGVPKLQHYWVIEVKLGIQALERGVLHQDCSINNTMIKDFANGLHNFLLDWEFAVWVMLQGEYDLGSTEAITKSGKTNVPLIQKNDIESLFYVFIWILILYDGPLGHKHQDISHEKTLLGLWSEKGAEDLEITRCTKFTFLNDPSKLRLDSKVLQYFQDLIPLANEWHILLGQSLLSGTAVQLSDIISLFDHFLASMPYEKPPEMMNAFQQIITQHKVLNSSMCLSQKNDMDVMSSAIMSSKCLCEEMSTQSGTIPLKKKDSKKAKQQPEANRSTRPTKNKCLGSPPIDLKESQSVATVGLCHSGRAGKKGGGHSAGQNAKPKSNVTPPPYAPPIVNGPSPADMPPNPIPQSSTAVATPVFHQCPTDSHCFGFSVLAQQPGHIVPPRMEPDLQVLNNPYISVIQGDQVPSNTSHLPTPQPNYQSQFIPHQLPATIPNSCINPSLDSSLSSRQTSATADVCHKSSEKLSSEGSSEEESESLSNNPSDTEAGEVSGNEFNKDEDDAFGWGAMNLRQSTHPGFSQETMTSNPIHHNSLPPDHEFQYSHDKHDNVALQSLQSKDKAQPEGSQCGTVVDVLECHHCTNGCPVPDRDLLTLAHDLVNEVSQYARAPCNSKKAKDEGPLPSQLRFYKAVWKDCLKDTKQKCRAAHALSNPFPSKSHDLNLSITEALVTVIVEWNQHGVQFEDGYWPDHKQDMACLLLGDISTWCSELKSVTLATTPSAFNLIPPSDVAPWVHVQWIETAAAKLLDNLLLLQDSFNKNGKTRNFARSALKEAVIQFYYTGTYQITDKCPESFNNSVPLSCLALIAAALVALLRYYTY
ncbi:hypothetical protein F5J12DRAFT_782901 [Pisolithus orientalis]|uniref:uncharacterized protein n=1 Tax=Pisolithus orientalis TaxID=936130 RepID=UPI002224E166|nr:uncharacterized protein F5J12DRAFT_782901 [Pisolithus orientalis]KAI6006655.1 hypothetical protein F5J12DRAFT_782901 [Pisolithus orientalis]